MVVADVARRLPVGAEVVADRGVHFRVWAPIHDRVQVVLEEQTGPRSFPLQREEIGFFSGLIPEAKEGTLYRFRLGDDESLYPDPVSRFQPQGPHGPSRVVDPTRFLWADSDWKGASLKGQVIYELHVGTFTREGTFEAASCELAELAELGITCIELMPLADFPGRFGWGYDGVNFFAPTRLYGEPDSLRGFVNKAHATGLAVILDVVYNHFGPDGNYLTKFAPDYFSKRGTEWGDSINFDGENSGPVREFFIANARCWIEEYHFDGLRLDATQSIFDDSREHILQAIARDVRVAAAGRATIVIAENETQDTRLARHADTGGYGIDGLWNDDFHHSAVVALTGRSEAYYSDYRGAPQEFISTAKYGYLFQGQRYKWQRKRRGTPTTGLRPEVFVNYIQNHDQVANSVTGERLHRLAHPGGYRAMTALTLLLPGTPMIFMGQEFAASAPFLFFADHNQELARLVRKGRAEFLAQFRSAATREARDLLADPADTRTFERCKLDFSERRTNRAVYDLHRDLLRLRRSDPVFAAQAPGRLDGAVLSSHAFVLRFFGVNGADRLLLVNLGIDLNLNPAPEPLLAPPAGAVWNLIWSSEAPRYGGSGIPRLETKDNWQLPGMTAAVLAPIAAEGADDPARGGDEPSEEEESRRERMMEWKNE